MSRCTHCPYNGGAPREEEIICRLDRDPRECHRRYEEMERILPEPKPWELSPEEEW